jgi:hypothetical protein
MPSRVCQAWHRTSEVQGLVPGMRGAEGEEKGQGVTARWGLEEAPSTRAGRRTGTGYEVWCTRDERARDREGLHPQGVYLINPASTHGTFGVVPWEIGWWSRKKRTEGGAIRAERPADVSRGYRRPGAGEAREAPHGRKAGERIGRAATRVGRRPERGPARG